MIRQIYLDTAIQDPEAAPVIVLVNKVLVKALKEKASDIHIEPQEEMRIQDGAGSGFEPLPRKSFQP